MTKLSKSQILKGTALPVAARSLEIFGEFFPASKNGAMRMKPVASTFELRSSLRNFESQNEYGYKPCIKRRFQNAETLQSRNQKNSS